MRKPKYRIIENGLGQFHVQTQYGLFGQWQDFFGNWFSTLEEAKDKLEIQQKEEDEHREYRRKFEKIVRVWK